MKSAKYALAFLLFVGAVFCWAQQDTHNDQSTQASNNSNPVQLVAESTKAIDYRQGSKSDIAMKGSDLMPEANGKAEVDTKSTPTQLRVEIENLKPANSFGLEYLTYVLWAISPDGVPSNLGELDVHGGKGGIRASTPMQAFALVVTAEPYFAVTQPSEKLISQNQPGEKTEGLERAVNVHYEAVPASLYASQNQPIENPVYGIDKKVPLALSEARNAVRIAKVAHADQYASSPLDRAQQLLSQADDYYSRKQPTKSIETIAREATSAAEAARVSAIKAEQQAKNEQEKQVVMAKAAKAQADAEAQTREAQEAKAQADAQAQQAQQAEQARQAAEQQAAQAQAAAQQAAQQAIQQQTNSGQQVQADQQAAAQQAQQQADQARQDAAAAQQRAQDQERLAQRAEQQLQQQQAAAQQAQQQLQQEQTARQQAEQQAQASQQQAQATQQQLQQSQQQVQQAQTEKEQVRQRLLGQLNQVLQTKDSARGLIVNMPDVLFKLNSASLTAEARERLAKVAGILIAYPDIKVEVDGYTDNTGPLAFNEQLSQQRADTVRSYLVQQGVPSRSAESKGFGPNDPIASNDSPEGRRQNRRVNLVVSGEAIGAQVMEPR